MKYSSSILYFICSFFITSSFTEILKAQNIVSTAGDHFKNNTAQLSWTVGEVTIETLSGTSNILTQGFHQTNLIATAINEILDLGFEIKAYPNPTQDYLILKISKDKLNGMQYKLYDMQGKLLHHKLIEESETEISFKDLVPSTYLIKVIEMNKELKTFMIVKQ
ncbi:hypothetical protein A2Z67_02415 [Candidatus Woesebacteria bacterium RBG_13_36_22]|uniref:Secretion system C-terminal sorting domain-containing protein n=1 Tax=Candidatus Woesebacteria bacterium RBG_13_36_22 TaxID=1802478 RepID=A0A1F7X383_9BACT|nr:MAG: hypothetical protein A2Z67_02415 [Candidatus Woesebacteria bacterium RBG_13_36_22]